MLETTKDKDLKATQQLLDHSDSRTTERYARRAMAE
jgi:site-specific recombinase XerD